MRPAGSAPTLPPFAPLNTLPGRKFLLALMTELGGVDLVIFDNVMSLIAGDQKDGNIGPTRCRW